MEPEAGARSRKLSKKRKNALTRPETVPSQGQKRALGVREPPRQPNRPGNPPNPEPGPGALACCLGRNQREGFPLRQFQVKPDRLLGGTTPGACRPSTSLLTWGPFPQPALPGVPGHTNPSATLPTRPAPHGVPVGACTPLTEFPVLPRLPSSMHAGATTPADAARCTCRFSSRATDGLPLIQGGSASALPVSRPAQRSLHVPACMVAELLNATLLSGVLQSMSLPPRTAPAATSRKRQLLGGIRTHQENAPFHGALGSVG